MLNLKMNSWFRSYLSLIAVLILILKSSTAHVLDILRLNELYYPTGSEYPHANLSNGDSEFLLWHLDNPINFYSEKYDQLYVSMKKNKIFLFKILCRKNHCS